MGERRRRAAAPPRQVLLVVCNKGIGDAVEALPTFELINQHWPRTRLVAGTFRDAQVPVLRESREIAAVVRLAGSVKDASASLRALHANVAAMRGCDAVLFLYKRGAVSWPLVVAARLAGARALYGHRFGFRDPRVTTYSIFPEHVSFQLVAAELLLGLPLARLCPLRLRPAPHGVRFAEAFCQAQGLAGPTILINTRGLIDRTWGVARFADLANRLAAQGVGVVFNGGTREQVQEFEDVAPHLRPTVRLLPRPSIAELLGVLARVDLLIGEPSGPTTFAMALGTPTLSIEGPGEYEYPGQERIGPLWWPRGPRHRVVSGVERCQLLTGGGAGCRCLHQPRLRTATRQVLKAVGLWKPLKRLWRAMLQRGGRRSASAGAFTCLETIQVDEVVSVALSMLGSVPVVGPASEP